MNYIIELGIPLETPLSENNLTDLKSLDPLRFFPERDEIDLEDFETIFWLDENDLAAGAETSEEQALYGAFWRISSDRTKLTYSHTECL